MGSILTNNAALVALQTLNTINRDLGTVQDQISTGLAIGDAADDAAIFAISQVARSDVAGFEAIQSSLDLGQSNLTVAASATDQISDILNDVRGLVVQAGEAGFDPDTINDEIGELIDQVQTIVDSAQFNGTNLLDGSTATLDILSSLSRDNTGAVSTDRITLTTTNLNTAAGAARAGLAGSTGVDTGGEDSAAFAIAAGSTTAQNIVIDDANLVAGDRISVTIDNRTASITLSADDIADGDTAGVAAASLRNEILALGIDGLVLDATSTAGTIAITNNGTGNADRTLVAEVTSVGTGGLAAFGALDVSAGGDQTANLAIVDAAINAVVGASADIGTVQSRVQIQADFQQTLIDNFQIGIGSLVDADLEEASARLQSLQVQQQLATQSLSIANQAPQSILALFR